MSIGKFIWKLYKGHILITMMLDTFMLALILIFPNQTWYQVLISWGILGVYWYFIYCTFDKEALADAKMGSLVIKSPLLLRWFLIFPIIFYLREQYWSRLFLQTEICFDQYFRIGTLVI